MIIIQENQHGKWVDIERDVPRSTLLQVLAIHDGRNHKGLRAIEIISTVGPKVNVHIPIHGTKGKKKKEIQQSELPLEVPDQNYHLIRNRKRFGAVDGYNVRGYRDVLTNESFSPDHQFTNEDLNNTAIIPQY